MTNHNKTNHDLTIKNLIFPLILSLFGPGGSSQETKNDLTSEEARLKKISALMVSMAKVAATP